MKLWLALGLLVGAAWRQLAVLGLAVAEMALLLKRRSAPAWSVRAGLALWAVTVAPICGGIGLGGLP